MINIKKGKLKSLYDLAKDHCLNVKPIIENKMAARYLDEEVTPNEKSLYDFLRQGDRLTDILIGKPEKLEGIIDEVEAKNFDQFWVNKQGGKASTDFGKEVLKIFYYSEWRSLPETIDWIGNEYDVSVCCYCNRQYTSTIEILNDNDVSERKLLFQLDHFLPKVIYPFLALSFYNLVPSCSSCNSSFKSSKPYSIKNYLHPYADNFHKLYKFKLLGKSTDDYFFNKQLKFSIKLVPRNSEPLFESEKNDNRRAEETAKAFHLEDVYEKHKDVVFELIQKHLMYNQSYINSLFQQYQGKLFSSKEELMLLLLGNHFKDEDIGKRPLAKLTKDIYEELGL